MTKPNHIPAFDDMQGCACFNLRAAARALTRAYDEALRPVGLKATQFTILVAISQVDEAVPIGTLAKTLSMDRTTLTRNLKPLMEQGLLEAVEAAEGADRRRRPIAITARGRDKLAEAMPRWRAVQARIAEGLGARRWSGLLGAPRFSGTFRSARQYQNGQCRRGRSANQRISPSATSVSVPASLSRITAMPRATSSGPSTMTRRAPATRSIAPPIPLTIFPGIIQLARFPFSSTSIPPRMQRSS